jgi:hypothetical protein
MKQTSFIINLKQSYIQDLGVAQRIIGLMPISQIVAILEKIDLKANVRDSKKSSITQQIQNTLSLQPNLMPLKSKGILLSCSGLEQLEEGMFRLDINDRDKEGIIDGGHNTLAIGKFILDCSLIHAGETFRSKALIWKNFRKEFDQNIEFVAKYLSSDIGKRQLATLVSVEILFPKSDHIEDVLAFNSILTSIQSARNNNSQVKLPALMNKEGKFDKLKSSIPVDLNEKIQWHTNDGNTLTPDKLVAMACIPINALLVAKQKNGTVFKDISGKPIKPIGPTAFYSSKSATIKLFNKFMESPDIWLDEKNEKLLDSLFEIIGSMPSLFDEIYNDFPKEFDVLNKKKFRTIPYVKNELEKKSIKSTPFYGRPTESAFPEAYVYPVVYSLVGLLEFGSEVNWSTDPKKFIKSKLAQILEEYHDPYMKDADYNPQRIGKKKEIYLYLEKSVQNLSK